jgi:hypothetical protein
MKLFTNIEKKMIAFEENTKKQYGYIAKKCIIYVNSQA